MITGEQGTSDPHDRAPDEGSDEIGPTEPRIGSDASAPEPVAPGRSRRRLWVAGVVALLALCLTAGVVVATRGPVSEAAPTPSLTASPSPTQPQPPTAEVAAVLQRHSAAVRDRDRAAFLADVDPAAKSFVAAQKQLYANLRQLPLAHFAWTPAGFGYTTVKPKVGDLPYYVPAVNLTYQLKGFDDGVSVVKQALTFVQRDGRWYIHSDADHEADVAGYYPEPWDLAPIVVVRTSHTLVMGSRREAPHLRSVALQAEAAISDVRSMWSALGMKSVVIALPDDRKSIRTYFSEHGPNGPDAGEAYAVYGKHARSGMRVIVNTHRVPIGHWFMPALLRHEITHVATTRWNQAGTPDWLIEGVADWTAYRHDPYRRGYPKAVFAKAATGHLLTELPSNGTFYKQKYGYDWAYLLCWYIVRTYGQGDLIKLYRTSQTELPADTLVDARKAIRKVLGVSQARLLSDFNRWAETTVRRG